MSALLVLVQGPGNETVWPQIRAVAAMGLACLVFSIGSSAAVAVTK
jgi:hypothetical protein